MRLVQRLAEVERASRTTKVDYRIFWHDELLPCEEHVRCHVEVTTGEHHTNVFTLTFADETMAR
jgi:hypothetical protein